MGVRDADFYQTISNAPFSKSCPNGVEEADAKRKSGWWKKSENFPTPGLGARPGRRNTQEGAGATMRSIGPRRCSCWPGQFPDVSKAPPEGLRKPRAKSPPASNRGLRHFAGRDQKS